MDEMVQVSEACCESFMKQQPDAIVKLEQKVGQVVHVPPGWLHSVFTLQPCVKMAWDFMESTHLAWYAAAWMHIATRVPGTAKDYMWLSSLLVKHALEH